MTALRVEGEVNTPRDFGFADLAALPNQVPDVGRLIPGREGSAVRLGALLEATGPRPGVTHMTLPSRHGGDSRWRTLPPRCPRVDSRRRCRFHLASGIQAARLVAYGLAQCPPPPMMEVGSFIAKHHRVPAICICHDRYAWR